MKSPTFLGFVVTAAIMLTTLFVMDKCSAQTKTASVNVTIPAVFRWADGVALVPRKDFKHTQVMYGTCSRDAALLKDMQGGTNIAAGQSLGRINYVPIGQRWCYVATVIGMDDAPIGRSNVFEFTLPANTKPGSVINLKALR
jgi:hypothetical protein